MQARAGTPQDEAVLTRNLGTRDKLIALAIFLFWLVYENVVFFYPLEYGGALLAVLTNAIKLLLPFALLSYTGLPAYRTISRGYVSLYIVFFVAFLLWGTVPTFIYGDPLSWVKLLPRFVFFLSVAALFLQRPAAFSVFAKCMVLYVLSALAQYILLYLTGAYDNTINFENQYMAGPYGLLGNVTSMMSFPGAPFPFVRLAGFWNEPSNASASAFAAFFLARYLAMSGEGRFWRRASYGCLVAGLLTLSNAGYFAIGSALLAGLLFGVGKFTLRRTLQAALFLPIAVSALIIVVYGRTYVAENMPDNIWARAITGAQDTEATLQDPTAGRAGLASTAVEKSATTIIGVGIQEVGSGGIDGPASAPLYWLLLTGVPGLALLLAREGVLLLSGATLLRSRPATQPLVQALVVVMAQHLSYGTWMNPNYLILAAMVLVCSSAVTRARV